MLDKTERKSLWFVGNVMLILLLAVWFLDVAGVKEASPTAVLWLAGCACLSSFLVHAGRQGFGIKSESALILLVLVSLFAFIVSSLATGNRSMLGSFQFLSFIFFIMPPVAFYVREHLIHSLVSKSQKA